MLAGILGAAAALGPSLAAGASPPSTASFTAVDYAWQSDQGRAGLTRVERDVHVQHPGHLHLPLRHAPVHDGNDRGAGLQHDDYNDDNHLDHPAPDHHDSADPDDLTAPGRRDTESIDQAQAARARDPRLGGGARRLRGRKLRSRHLPRRQANRPPGASRAIGGNPALLGRRAWNDTPSPHVDARGQGHRPGARAADELIAFQRRHRHLGPDS